MDTPPLLITGLDEAETLLLSDTPRIAHLVSIAAPGSPLPEGFERCPDSLRLEFADIGRDHGENVTHGPSREHAERLISFACSIQSSTDNVLIHCAAGISRSTAAALILLATWLGPGREGDAVEHLLDIQTRAQPNRLLVQLGDDALERSGALVDALRASLFARPPT